MKLGELAEVRMGYPFRSKLEHDPRGDVAVIQMKDIDDANLLRPEDTIKVALPSGKERHLLRRGDLLFRSRGRSYGAAAVTSDPGPAVLAAPMLVIRPHDVLPAYLCWFINTPSTQTQLAAFAKGTSVQMISADALKDLDVPLPPAARQLAIAEAAALAQREQELMAEIAAKRKRLLEGALMGAARNTW